MPIPSPSLPGIADHELRARARRQVHHLMGETLAYFAAHGDTNLQLIREHLLTLVDARPPAVMAQNLRSAHNLLQRQAAVFQQAYQAALQIAMDEELSVALPERTSLEVRKYTPADPLDGMSLTLIDVSEVERILLLDRVAQRFASHYESSVGILTQRIGALLGPDLVSQSCNPFRPAVFVRAFLVAWEKCGLDAEASQDLILALHPQHCIDLNPLYRDLNAALEQAGIEARPLHRIRRAQAGTSSSMPLTGDPAAPAPAVAQSSPMSTGGDGLESGQTRSAWGNLAPTGRPIAAHARQFLQRLGFASPANVAGNSVRDHDPEGEAGQRAFVAADPEFMGYLEDLQAGAGAQFSFPILEGEELAGHRILRHMRERDEVRRAPELDRGTVDALAEVFDFVFADPAIPLQLKFVIGRLQIPVLKAAMIDRDFFLSASHPARRLVDALAQASVAWTPGKGENDPLYVSIERTVKRVLTEFEDDLALFDELLLEFTEFLLEAEQQAQRHIEPAASQEQVGESWEQALAHADEVVHACVQALPAELPLAPFLAPFLATQWREVMARAWLEAPSGTAPWERNLKVMDQLVWSTQPKTGAQERRQLVAALPDLVRDLNAGLDAIDWTGEARATFTRRLIATHMLAIRMTQPATADPVSSAAEERVGKEAMQALDQRRASQVAGQLDDFDAMAHAFVRGTWFDFALDKTTQHRCRLSWVSPLRTRLLFTNREGYDAFVRSEREVAALLRQGQLSVIEQAPIVARALDRIMADTDSQAGSLTIC